jgi:hypothetical protein
MKTNTHTTTPPSFFLGIDVGKKDLFCHIIAPGEPCSARFDNTPTGIALLLKWVLKTAPPAQLCACLEQTGHYGDLIAEALHDTSIAALHLVNPQRIKAESDARQRAERINALTALSQMTYQKIIYERELLLQVAPGFRTVSFVRPGDAELTETAYEIRKSNVVSIQQLINLLNSPQTLGTIQSLDTRSLVEELSNNETSLPMLQEIQRLSTRLEKYEAELESLLQEKA